MTKEENKIYRSTARGKATRTKAHKAFIKRRRALSDAIKAVPCMDCGGVFPPCCMDFDHRDPKSKEFGIAPHLHLAWSRILREIEKCDIVCANCHRIRTVDRRKW